MTTGTGIFLGCLIIAVVALFGMTKDRWRWSLIVLSLLGCIVLIAPGIGSWLWYAERRAAESRQRAAKAEEVRQIESRLEELDREFARRKQIYAFLSTNSEALKIVAAYKRGETQKDAARSLLSAIIPLSLGPLPPNAEDGNWLEVIKRITEIEAKK